MAAAIKAYISNKYEQHPEVFTADLEAIDALRQQAAAVLEPHVSGVLRLQAYAAQLVWMAAKFPLDIGLAFTWHPSIGYHTDTPISQNNLRFELSNIIFNLGVLYCQLAVHANKTTSDGLKAASNYFCQSAGVFSHLRRSIVPEMRSAAPEDMDPMTLESVERLLLAQAQECFWQKAVKDGMRDATIAKLAAKVSDLYMEAGDFGIQSDAVPSEWIHHMNAKHHHFAAAAQFRQACDCLEKRKYGEEVARLKDSIVCANDGLKESRYLNKTVLQDLQGLKTKVQDDLARAEKDNDMIYLQTVPPKSELKTLDRASMVSSKVPKEVQDPVPLLLGDDGELGKPLFTKLVPYSVHVAASIYVSRRDAAVGAIVDKLEKLTSKINELLTALNLPGALQAVEKPLGLPPGLVTHAEEIRQHNGMIRIQRVMDDVDRVKNADRKTFEEGLNLLHTEAAEDDQARIKYGTDRWTRPASQAAAPKLYQESSTIEGYLRDSASSDATVRDKVKKNEQLIRLLNGTDRDLEEYVPSSRRAAIQPAVERELTSLRTALNNLHRLESKRRRKIEMLKSKAQHDDVTTDLLREAGRLEREFPSRRVEAVQFEPLFSERLKRYAADEAIVTEEEQEQQLELSRVTQANASFTAARKGDTASRERELALQRLENSYFAYKEAIQNLDAGRKFYNDLSAMVTRFRDDCRAFAYQRRSEAGQLAQEISLSLPSLSSLSLNEPVSSRTAGMASRPTTRSSTARHVQPPEHQALAAPKPVKPVASVVSTGDAADAGSTNGSANMAAAGMWTPDMPIRFDTAPSQQQQQQQQQQQPRDSRWDPSKSVNFG